VTAITVRVFGTPGPQGSKRHVGNGQMAESSAKVKPWREAVKYAVLEQTAGAERFGRGVPLTAILQFFVVRPKAHYRANGELKESAPCWAPLRPDVDKLARSTLDGLGESGVFAEDAQVVSLLAVKRYATGGDPVGCRIDLWQSDST
jgi:Holliday junction resolvase RusA-like endonuclease